jgi:delta 1-pyrroline-5-carboxylate dehydrogenase
MNIQNILADLGIQDQNHGVMIGAKTFGSGATIDSHSPVDGKRIASLSSASNDDYERVMAAATDAFVEWRKWTAPQRGEVVRQYGDALRAKKDSLGALVSYEMGKSYQEGLGEVQEMIDICDFAVGQSRQLYGLTMHSERPNHRMYEQYHPLGVVGIISAFNFPVAVWCWNTALAWISGDVCVWKPSGVPEHLERGRRSQQTPSWGELHCERRLHSGRVDDRRQAGAPRLRHRIHPHGQDRRPSCGCALGSFPARVGRKQRHHHHA